MEPASRPCSYANPSAHINYPHQRKIGKTEICVNDLVNQCMHGAHCRFAHNVRELAPEIRARKKKVPCPDDDTCYKVKVHACTFFHPESLLPKKVTEASVKTYFFKKRQERNGSRAAIPAGDPVENTLATSPKESDISPTGKSPEEIVAGPTGPVPEIESRDPSVNSGKKYIPSVIGTERTSGQISPRRDTFDIPYCSNIFDHSGTREELLANCCSPLIKV